MVTLTQLCTPMILPSPALSDLSIEEDRLHLSRLPFPYNRNFTISPALLAHVLGNSFVPNRFVGKEALEGISPLEILTAFRHYFTHKKSLSSLPSKLLKLEADVNQCLIFKKTFEEFEESYLAAASSKDKTAVKKAFAAHAIEVLSDDKISSYLLPFGWKARPSGHQVYLYLAKNLPKKTFSLKLFNMGAGVQFHSSVDVSELVDGKLFEKKKHLPYMQHDDIPEAQMLNSVVWQAYFEIETGEKTFYNTFSYDEESIYFSFFRAIAPEFGQNKKYIASAEIPLCMTPQNSGICSYKSLVAFFKSYLGEKEWRIVKFEFQTYLLSNLGHQLQQEREPKEKSEEETHVPRWQDNQPDLITLADKIALIKKAITKYSSGVFKSVAARVLSETRGLQAIQLRNALQLELDRLSALYWTLTEKESTISCSFLEKAPLSIQFETHPIESEKKIERAQGLLKLESLKSSKSCYSLTLSHDFLSSPTLMQESLQKIHKELSSLNLYDHRKAIFDGVEKVFSGLPPPNNDSESFWMQIPMERLKAIMTTLTALSEFYWKASFDESPLMSHPARIFYQQKIYAIMHQLFHRFRHKGDFDELICNVTPPFLTHNLEDLSAVSGDFFITHPQLNADVEQTILNLRAHQSTSPFFNYDISSENTMDSPLIGAISEESIKSKEYNEITAINKYLKRKPRVVAKIKKSVEAENENQKLEELSYILVAHATTDLEGEFLPYEYCAFKKHYFLLMAMAVYTTPAYLTKNSLRKLDISIQGMENLQPRPSFQIIGMDLCLKQIPKRGNWLLEHRYLNSFKSKLDDEEAPVRWTNPHLEYAFKAFFHCTDSSHHKITKSKLQNFFLSNEHISSYDNLSLADEARKLAMIGCKDDQAFQVIKTITFFEANLDLLLDIEYQHVCMSLLFEMGILSRQLKNAPHTARMCIDFSTKSFAYFSGQKDISATLFMFRVGRTFDAYIRQAIDVGVPIDRHTVAFTDPCQTLHRLAGLDNLLATEKCLILTELLILYADYSEISDEIAFQIIRAAILAHEFHAEAIEMLPYLSYKAAAALRKAAAFVYNASQTDKSGFMKSFGESLDKIVKEILPEAKPQRWIENFPLFSTADKNMQINLLKGTFECSERRTGLLPASFIESDIFRKHFNIAHLTDIKRLKNEYFFNDPNGFLNSVTYDEIARDWKVRKNCAGHFYVPLSDDLEDYLNSYENMKLYPWKLFCVWQREDAPQHLYIFNKFTHAVEACLDLSRQELVCLNPGPAYGWQLVNKQACANNFSPFVHLDNLCRVWKDPEGHVKIIELPKLELIFSFDKFTQKISCERFPGFHVAEKQLIKSLHNFKGYLILENSQKEKQNK